ncbi:MAG: hypothetical protein JXQ81_06160 [Desulfuromonadales bacterium]|nr:hypothetical protein [Desulfuromonadales bacterium]MBN2792076.1 hypothetical protein [Desulfuromonadales bacterium]
MTIINPNLPANLFVQPSSQPLSTSDLRQLDLRLEQVVRATVVESGIDKTLLEMNHQQYRAETERELQVGQNLRLQVLRVHPKLEFRVLNDPLKDRLAMLLPLLTRSYDWGQLLEQFRQSPAGNKQSAALEQVFNQLRQVLGSDRGVYSATDANISRIVAQLAQLDPAFENFSRQQLAYLPTNNPYERAISQEAVRGVLSLIPQLTQKLQVQLAVLSAELPVVNLGDWLADTRALLTSLQGGNAVPVDGFSASGRALLNVLAGLRDHSAVPPQFAAEVERLLKQLEQQTVKESTPAHRSMVANAERNVSDRLLSKGTEQVFETHRAGHGQGGNPQESQTILGHEISSLLKNVQHLRDRGAGLPAPLLGRLEGLVIRLQALNQGPGNSPVAFPGLEMLLNQMTDLVNQPQQNPSGGHLGVLAQLFGLYLETELLQGKTKEALASLKLALLTLKHELGEEASEPLRRLELFQLCKARLAEDHVQFLPLPFHELEEGYLLAEKQKGVQPDGQGGNLKLSLALRLSALGNMRVDMVYGKHGLQLCVAGENQEKKNYLQNAQKELEGAITMLELRGISFAADAQPPAKQLQQRLLPQARSMLDARV